MYLPIPRKGGLGDLPKNKSQLNSARLRKSEVLNYISHIKIKITGKIVSDFHYMIQITLIPLTNNILID